MREIKFRAWFHWIGNNDCGWMRYFEIGVNEMNDFKAFILAEGGEFMTGMGVFKPLKNFCWEKEDLEFKLMQYTGLKDKNGKEIYEGDIVKKYDKITQKWLTGIIKFQEGSFVWQSIKDKEFIQWLTKYPAEWKVIGNRFENPELLKED